MHIALLIDNLKVTLGYISCLCLFLIVLFYLVCLFELVVFLNEKSDFDMK